MEFGVAAGVLQVAGAGVQLAKTLHSCATNMRDAKKDITAIATEVQLTSSALENLGIVLDKDRDICSAKLQEDVRAAMKGCENCFNELNTIVKAVKRSTKPNAMGFATVSLSSRTKWMLDKNKVKALKIELGQQKITLTLMLEILACASRRSIRHGRSAEITASDRRRIEQLISSNEELHRSLAGKSRTNDTLLETSLDTSRGQGSDDRGSGHDLPRVQHSGPNDPRQPLDHYAPSASHTDDLILARIRDCQTSIDRLAKCLQEVTLRYSENGQSDLDSTRSTYKEVRQAMKALPDQVQSPSASSSSRPSEKYVKHGSSGQSYKKQKKAITFEADPEPDFNWELFEYWCRSIADTQELPAEYKE